MTALPPGAEPLPPSMQAPASRNNRSAPVVITIVVGVLVDVVEQVAEAGADR